MSQQQTQVKIAGITDTGLRRSANEDYIGFDQNLGIAVLADGMGGHKAGGTASRMAVDSVLEALKMLINQETSGPVSSSQLLAMVSNTITDTNGKIYQTSSVNSDFKGMGATVVAAVIKDTQLVVGHVGESVRTQQDQIVLLQFVAGRIYFDFCSGSQRPSYYVAYGCGPGFQFRIEAFID